MFKHVFNPSSGEFVTMFKGPSPGLVAFWEGEGKTVVDGTSAERPATHNYKGGVLTPKLLVELIPDKTTIEADGADEAAVGVDADGGFAEITLLAGGVEEVVALAEGYGALPPIVAESPCLIEVTVADDITFKADPVEIEAVQSGS